MAMRRMRDGECLLPVGKRLVGVVGRASDEFGDPVFQLSYLVFEDGTTMDVEGEHDFPYVGPEDEVMEAELERMLGQDEGE